MAALLGELGLSRLADIPGLTVVAAAAILAETSGPRRYDSSSSLVKHAGLAPADNASGGFSGQAHISRRGHPACGWPSGARSGRCCGINPRMAAKYAALTGAAVQREAA
jgi:transposase